MKILYISTDGIQSGAGLCMMQQARLGKKHGIQYYCVLPWHGNLEKVARKEKIPYCVIRSYPWLRNKGENDTFMFRVKWSVKRVLNLRAEYEIYQIIKEKKIDIVHINTLCSGVGAMAAHRAGVPVVWHFRELVEEGLGSHYICKEKSIKLIRKSCQRIAVSETVKRKYSKYFGDSGIVTIYDGVDVDKFYKPDKELFLDKKKVQILMAGNICHFKGQYQLLHALTLMTKQERETICVDLAGIGEKNYLQELKEYIKKHGLEENVHFLGFRTDIDKLWENADIAVICSQAEAFGRVTVEAMLSGCVVIGARRAGTEELIKAGETGYLYSYGEVEELKECLLKAISEKEYSKKIASNGREYAKTFFDSEINASKIEEIYKKNIKKDRRNIKASLKGE